MREQTMTTPGNIIKRFGIAVPTVHTGSGCAPDIPVFRNPASRIAGGSTYTNIGFHHDVHTYRPSYGRGSNFGILLKYSRLAEDGSRAASRALQRGILELLEVADRDVGVLRELHRQSMVYEFDKHSGLIFSRLADQANSSSSHAHQVLTKLSILDNNLAQQQYYLLLGAKHSGIDVAGLQWRELVVNSLEREGLKLIDLTGYRWDQMSLLERRAVKTLKNFNAVIARATVKAKMEKRKDRSIGEREVPHMIASPHEWAKDIDWIDTVGSDRTSATKLINRINKSGHPKLSFATRSLATVSY